MTKLGIITAETLIVEKQGQRLPTIVLVGRDETGMKRMWRTVFWPYLYLTEEDYMRLKDQSGYSLSKYVQETEGTKVRSLGKKSLTKLILNDSQTVVGIIQSLIKYGKTSLSGPIFSYEADLSMPTMLPIRFLIDKGIKSGVSISASGDLTPIDFTINLRKWHLDFEALSDKQCGSGPKKDEPIPIMSFHDNYSDTLYTLLVVNPKWPKERREGFHYGFKTAYKSHKIMGFKNEGFLLEALVKLVNELDPDLFSAWNLDRYDIVKWTQRMIEQNLDPKSLSPFRSFGWKRLPYRIKGRILFDLMKAFKRFTDAELRSYALGAISEEEGLAIEKIPLKKPTQWIWDNDPEILFRRNVNDVLILKALDEKYDLVEMFDDLRREFGALFHEVLLNYRVLDTALMRFVNGKIALGTAFKARKNKEKYLGAIVIEPVPGEYSFVAQFDFQREYPSLIKAFNIGPETYRDENYTGPCYTIEYKGAVFKFIKSPKSLLAQLIDFFFRKRDEYEGYYQKAIEAKDEVKIKAWYRKIFNIKKMTNAIYGVMDFPSFRLFRQECSAATCILGRIGIEQIAIILKPLGYKLIYGDTDSSFVPLKTRTEEGAIKEAQFLAEKINEGLTEFFKKTYDLPSAPTGLGVKKVYDSFLLIAKKNYAGRSFWDEKKGFKVDYNFINERIINFIAFIGSSYGQGSMCREQKPALSAGTPLLLLSNLVQTVVQTNAKENMILKSTENMLENTGKNLMSIPMIGEKDTLSRLKEAEEEYLKICGRNLGIPVEDAVIKIEELLKSIISQAGLKEKELSVIIRKELETNWKFFVLTVIKLLIGNYEREPINSDPWFDFKGLEVIRSDSSSFEKEVMEKIVRLVLDGHRSDIGGVRNDAFLRVSSRTLDPLMVSYPLQISHNLEEYPKEDKNGRPQMPSHVRAAVYSNRHLNTDFGRGDKPRRLPIKESDLKVSSSQSTLFKSDNLFPSECDWKGFSFQCRGISITEDSEIPEWFLERIDWEKIKKRLSEKIDKITRLVKIEVDA